jgi:hypothetical protein
MLLGPRRSNVLTELGLRYTESSKVLSRDVQTDVVRAADKIGLVELHGIVLPETDLADVVRARRFLLEREKAAARAGKTLVHRTSMASPNE